ncbi:OprD family outer membrane porin [Acinetobacter sp. ANC 3882]|uniref:OprD family outer membrane porin n=1 Tax=Acinetobacter sp. ANC 3882 TaxID=2923423 RepID=UPI001F4ADE81|nr:OprD family outer membrane porin [Acinetobacter sp. ANC 3882]MCH7313791.1 OprD family porin [Acinetobacter sp. ANC 3882]
MLKPNTLYKAQRVAFYTIFGCLNVNAAYADFLEDSQKSLYLRNFYVERDYENTDKDLGSWSQGFTGRFESGYTDTPVQVGLDLGFQYALRLTDRYDERLDTAFKYDTQAGRQERDYLKLGATLKLKYQNTELKVGELFPKTPVLFIDDSRQLVTTYAGAMLENKDIKNLKVSAGRFTHVNARDNDEYEKITLGASTDPSKNSDGLNFIGLDYAMTPKFSTAYWFGQLEDIYQQHYVGASYAEQIDKTKVKVDARYFNYKEDGDAYFGDINAKSLGLQASAQNGPHTVVAGIQKQTGDHNIPLLNGYVPQLYLQSWSALAFYKAREFTWHALYSYDFTNAGVPGLKLTLRYLNGSEIYRPGLKDNKETETDVIVNYVIPEGKLKGLGFEWRHIRANIEYGAGNNPGTDYVENRIMTMYTFKF